MIDSKFIAVDLGAESGRVIIGILEDETISLEEIHRFPNRQVYKNENIFWDVPYLFTEIKKALSLSSRQYSKIDSIAIDTWGVDFGLLGKNNQLLELPHTYRDSRTNGIPEKVFQKIPENEIYERTGIQLIQINSLYQLFSIKLYNDPLLKKSDKLLFIPDLFNFLLTGEKKSEYTISSTSQLLNAKRKQFDEDIFSAIDLPINLMAPIVPPGTIIGKLLPEIANEIGLSIDVIAAASHDTASAVAAIPAQGDDWAYLSSGTWSLLGIESADPLIDIRYKYNFTNEGGVNNKITFLQNIPGLWFIQEIKKSWEKSGMSYSYQEITEMAQNPETSFSIIDPEDKLFVNPPDMIGSIKEFCLKTNQKVPATKKEFARSIIESLAVKYSVVLKSIEKISKKKINKIHIVGGGSRNELLNQLTADITGKDVYAGPVEASSIGNILVQAVAKGKIGSYEEAREIVYSSFHPKLYKPKLRKDLPNYYLKSLRE